MALVYKRSERVGERLRFVGRESGIGVCELVDGSWSSWSCWW